MHVDRAWRRISLPHGQSWPALCLHASRSHSPRPIPCQVGSDAIGPMRALNRATTWRKLQLAADFTGRKDERRENPAAITTNIQTGSITIRRATWLLARRPALWNEMLQSYCDGRPCWSLVALRERAPGPRAAQYRRACSPGRDQDMYTLFSSEPAVLFPALSLPSNQPDCIPLGGRGPADTSLAKYIDHNQTGPDSPHRRLVI